MNLISSNNDRSEAVVVSFSQFVSPVPSAGVINGEMTMKGKPGVRSSLFGRASCRIVLGSLLTTPAPWMNMMRGQPPSGTCA